MDDVETILDNIRCNASVLSQYHRKRYLQLKGRLKYFRIPVIVISSCNAIGATSFQSFVPQEYISLGNMFLSLIVGIIGSIELFYGIQKSMEIEMVGSKEFYVLATDIYKYLALKRENRVIDGQDFLTQSYSHYIKLVESSIILKKKVEDKLIIIEPKGIPLTISTDTFADSSDGSGDNNII